MAWTTATHDTNYDREDSFGYTSFACDIDDSLYTWGSPTTYFTRIVDLDYRGGNGNRGVCVMLSNRSLPTSGAFSTSYAYAFSTSTMKNAYIKAYNFSNQVFTNAYIYTTSGKKAFAIHSKTTASAGQPQLRYCVFGTGTSNAEYAYTKTSSGATNGYWSTRTWRPNDDGSESYFASITSTSTTAFTIVISMSLDSGYQYTFKMHTNSYPGKEGIVIATSKLSAPNVTSSGVARCSGIDVLQTYTTEATSDRTIYIHFRMDGDGFAGYGLTSTYNSSTNQYTTTSATGWAVGDVEVIRRRVTTITLNDNGGSGGSGTTKGYVGLPLDNVNVPTRSGSNGSFEFLGYWDTSSTTGGTQYYNATGGSVRNWDKTGTTATLYARWRNSLIYTKTATDFNIYTTTDDDTTPTTTVGTRELTLFSNLYASTGAVSSVLTVRNDDTTPTTTVTGWSFSTSTKKLTIPAGTPVATYAVDIRLSTTSSSTYILDSTIQTFWVIVIRTAASGYSNVTGLTYEQLNDFPAGSFTLSQSNLSTYFRGKDAYYDQLYNNGYSSPSNIDIEYIFVGGIVSRGQTQSYSSLGTTPTSRSTVSITQGYLIIMARHGSSTQTVMITSAYREANTEGSTEYKDVNGTLGYNVISPGMPSPSITNSLTASGGKIVIAGCYLKNGCLWYQKWTSGSYTQHTGNKEEQGVWKISDGGTYITSVSPNTNVTINGETYYEPYCNLNHRNMETTATTDTIYIIVANRHDTAESYVEMGPYSVTNTITNSNYSPSNYTASVTIGNGMTAAGGSATVSASASHEAYDYYTSGSYNNQHNVSDSVTWSITSNGNSRFTKSGSSISHSNMTTNASTDTVTVTAVNGASSAATGTSSKSITNSVSLTMIVGSDTITYNGETTVTVAASYSSGSIETDVTSSASMSLDPTGIVSIS